MIATLGDWTVRTTPEDPTAEELALGVRYRLTDVQRWHSPAPFRVNITDLPNGDGAFNPVKSLRSAKRMAVVGIVEAVDAETAEYDCWERIAALSPEGFALPLTVESNGRTRIMPRVWLYGEPDVVPFTPTKARFKIPVVATDPRKYGPALDIEPIGPAGDAGDGLVFPLFVDGYLDFGTFSPSGFLQITNEGRAESWPVFKVRGTHDAAGFEIVSDADALRYEAAVALGTEVTLSPYAGGRASIGSTDVSANLTQSDWPSIKPGETRTYVYNSLGVADSNARMTPLFSPAWW